MAVKRIVPNVLAADPRAAAAFYQGVLGLEVVMDLGWIVTFAAGSDAQGVSQISVASDGGSGTPLPHISIEVDDLEDVLARAKASGFPVEYGPVDEPWGVRRCYLRDPFGRLINVLMHR